MILLTTNVFFPTPRETKLLKTQLILIQFIVIIVIKLSLETMTDSDERIHHSCHLDIPTDGHPFSSRLDSHII